MPVCLGWAEHQNFLSLAPWRFWCRVKDHILQISIMQGQIKSMQVDWQRPAMPDLSSGRCFLRHQWTWGSQACVPEEMKIPCIEQLPLFMELPIHPSSIYWGIHLCRLTEDSFPDFVSCSKELTLPSKTCCLIVQETDKGLVKSRAHRAHRRSIWRWMWTPGAALVSLGQTWRRYNRCFLVFSAQEGRF